MSDMRRRQFITLLGAAAARPLVARAQQPAKLPTIGFPGASTPSVASQRIAMFVQRLRELGWIEGRSVAIEYRCLNDSGAGAKKQGFFCFRLFKLVLFESDSVAGGKASVDARTPSVRNAGSVANQAAASDKFPSVIERPECDVALPGR